MDVEGNHVETTQVARRAPLNKHALLCALLASTNSILLGYDIGVMSGAKLYIRDSLKLSSSKIEILVGILNVCSLVGSLASGKTSDWIGRRYTIVLAAATFLVGAILMGLAPSFPVLLTGRIIAGIGVGYSLMIAPVYTAEISPSKSRGLLTSLPEVFIVFGILLGYILNYALSTLPPRYNWRIMLGLAAIPSIVIGCGIMVMPESPRWLVMKGRLDEAKQVLIKVSDSREEADLRLAEIVDANQSALSSTSKGKAWKELLMPTRAIRRILVAALGINFFMQASGNDAVIYYLPELFKDAGIRDKRVLFGINVIMGFTKAMFVLVSACFLDRFGRRPLLLVGTLGMCVSSALLGLCSKILEHTDKPTWAVVLSIVSVCADVSFFSIGLGPITWVYSSEVFPLRLRAQGAALAISVNRVVSGVVTMTFLSVAARITFGGVFFALSGIMAAGTMFAFSVLPETKGKSLEEIQALFEDKETGDEGTSRN